MSILKISQSSLVASAEHHPDQKWLDVEFANGAKYRYYGVPADVIDGFEKADSAGSYLTSKIKKGGYRYRRLT
jgi:hypothetical protein